MDVTQSKKTAAASGSRASRGGRSRGGSSRGPDGGVALDDVQMDDQTTGAVDRISSLDNQAQIEADEDSAGSTPSAVSNPMVRRVIDFIAEHACCWTVSWLVVLIFIIATGALTLPLQLDAKFESFLVTDVPSAIRLRAFEAAKESGKKTGRRLQGSAAKAVHTSKDLIIMYDFENAGLFKGGLFHNQAIEVIAKFENDLRSLSGWLKLCKQSSWPSLCDPGMSFIHYALPSMTYNNQTRTVVPDELSLDGRGLDRVSTRTAFTLIEQHNVQSLLLPSDLKVSQSDDPTEEEPHIKLLRSAFRFKLKVCTASPTREGCDQALEAVRSQWREFCLTELFPFLRKGIPCPDDDAESLVQNADDDDDLRRASDGRLSDLCTEKGSLKVYWTGDEIEAFEMEEALRQDITLATASLTFVFLYSIFHTRSLMLSFFGPMLALSSVPLTFVLTAVVLGTTTVSFANFLSFFLVVGFGADVMMVYTDFWTESATHAESDADRLAWTYRRGIISSSATSFTTAVAFFANLASVIRSLRQFGLFMGACVMLAWVNLTVVYTPFLLLNTRAGKSRIYRRLCCGLSAAKPTGESLKTRRLTGWTRLVHRLRLGIVTVVALAVPLMVILAIPRFKAAEESPSIFRDDHNQNKGRIVGELFKSRSKAFGSSFTSPSRTRKVCTHDSSSSQGCAIFWCEASFGPTRPKRDISTGSVACNCSRVFAPKDCDSSASAPVSVRILSPTTLPDAGLQVALSGYLREHWPEGDYNPTPSESSRMLLQTWETGESALWQTFDWRSRISLQPTDDHCGWQDMCFCGDAYCTREDAVPLPELTVLVERRLQTSTAAGSTSKVRVVFGLYVDTDINFFAQGDDDLIKWNLLPYFSLGDPWTQRNIYSFCDGFPADLRVSQCWCWMYDFREYARRRSGRFPARAEDFNSLAMDFTQQITSVRGTRYLWVYGGEVRAMFVSSSVRVSENRGKSYILEYKKAWEEYVRQYNSRADISAQGAFVVSKLWVHYESVEALLSSTIQTLVVLAILAPTAVILLTGSCCLSILVVVSTTISVVGLLFYSIVLAGWEMGLIEVVAIIYFIGYALDYSLHVVNKYRSDECFGKLHRMSMQDTNEPTSVSYLRTRFSIRSMGGAIMGSAITTSGTSAFLVLCELSLFQRLGTMCLVITVTSVVVAMSVLPAALMVCGPSSPACCCCARRPSRR